AAPVEDAVAVAHAPPGVDATVEQRDRDPLFGHRIKAPSLAAADPNVALGGHGHPVAALARDLVAGVAEVVVVDLDEPARLRIGALQLREPHVVVAVDRRAVEPVPVWPGAGQIGDRNLL